jgi:hypothetical protein
LAKSLTGQWAFFLCLPIDSTCFSFFVLAKFRQKEKIRHQNSKIKQFSKFPIARSEGKTNKNCQISTLGFQSATKIQKND